MSNQPNALTLIAFVTSLLVFPMLSVWTTVRQSPHSPSSSWRTHVPDDIVTEAMFEGAAALVDVD